MPFKILRKRNLGGENLEMEIEAHEIAKAGRPGQFIIFRTTEFGERVPLTIAGKDPERGTITIIFQMVGKSTYELGDFEEGDFIQDVVGPLGQPTDISKVGTVVGVAGGLGTAVLYNVLKSFKEAGNRVIVIEGARRKDLLFLIDEIKAFADELHLTTDDGSYGRKGFVSDLLKEIMEREKVDLVLVCGPLIMMKVCAQITKDKGIKTLASLNTIMVDGTGMCGSCRLTYKGEIRFACVDGPDFDAHLVEWDELMQRAKVYQNLEKQALEKYLKESELRGCDREIARLENEAKAGSRQ